LKLSPGRFLGVLVKTRLAGGFMLPGKLIQQLYGRGFQRPPGFEFYAEYCAATVTKRIAVRFPCGMVQDLF